MTTMELSDNEIEILEIIRQMDFSSQDLDEIKNKIRTSLEELRQLSSQEKTPSEESRMHSKLPPGEPGWKFMEDARKLNFTPQDLADMEAAIEELEQVNLDEWDLSG